ncbi:VOC family protein [Paenibacillus chibensis]|uniref:VOC family protein n=1 Tax=Paenibacillus chibensis TaxID=59846 RepID=UPI00248263E9|nr:VOC family protein [Paenibacillus chibensis]MEC0370424.1 VOC family protein [Paenibacillus chibensis]
MSNLTVTPFLMFNGQAEEAMNFYLSVFQPSEIIHIRRYGADEPGTEGSVQLASFSLKGQTFMCIDSNIKHDFTFTPAISMFVNCGSDEEITDAFQRLSEGGSVLMPLSAYPFATKFGWVQDKYGVSWQLSL